jgi:hypothetical protein
MGTMLARRLKLVISGAGLPDGTHPAVVQRCLKVRNNCFRMSFHTDQWFSRIWPRALGHFPRRHCPYPARTHSVGLCTFACSTEPERTVVDLSRLLACYPPRHPCFIRGLPLNLFRRDVFRWFPFLTGFCYSPSSVACSFWATGSLREVLRHHAAT